MSISLIFGHLVVLLLKCLLAKYVEKLLQKSINIVHLHIFQLPWANVTRPHEERIYIQNQLLAKKGPPIPDELKQQHEAYDFIQLCLTPDLNERPFAKALLDHPYPRVRTGKIVNFKY